MGCFPLHRLIAPSLPSRRRIKILSADGRCLKFQAPLTVKEVLVDYPRHALFLPSVSITGSFRSKPNCRRAARPLSDTEHLLPGQLYCLISLPQHRNARSTSKPALHTKNSSSAPTEQRIKPPAPSKIDRRVSFAPVPEIIASSTEDGSGSAREEEEEAFVTEGKRESAPVRQDPAHSQPMEAMPARNAFVEALPPNSPNGAAGVRLRMVISRKQLEAMLAGSDKDATALLEGLLNPLIKQAAAVAAPNSDTSSWTVAVSAQKDVTYSLSSSSSSCSSSSRRPAMHCIPESPQVEGAENMP